MFPSKKVIKYTFIILLIQGASVQQSFSEVNEITEILFIGSSYFGYNDLPDLFDNLAEMSGKQVSIARQIQGGLYLSDHASSSTTELKINEKDWDFVILQGVGSVTAYPNYYTAHPVYPALETLQDKILKNCDSTKIVFCLPWAFEDGMTWVSGWTDTYTDMQVHIYENTLEWCGTLSLSIAPVGWSWYKVLDEKNYPLHYLHLSDWNHPSVKGSYLMACTIFSAVYQESCVGLNYNAGLSQEDAGYFQTIASNTVLDDLELWNIEETSTVVENVSGPATFSIHQNYPNPFNHTTLIKYEVMKSSFIEIAVFDVLGKIQTRLVSDYKIPDSYAIRFDGLPLPSGLYFYRISSDNQQKTKKMLLIK